MGCKSSVDRKTEMQRVQQVEFEILQAIDGVCKKEGIGYFLQGGTLLGAARHKDFIPWDDDLDIGMLREDYNAFLDIAPDALGEDYYVQHYSRDQHCRFAHIKVRKNGTLFLQQDDMDDGSNHGIWVDIFPFDYIASDDRGYCKQDRYRRITNWMYYAWFTDPGKRSSTRTRTLVRNFAHFILNHVPVSWLWKRFDKCVAPPLRDSEIITCLHYQLSLLRIPVLRAFPLVSLEFHGFYFPVFANWEETLEQSYGDWKTLPPVEERQGHSPLVVDFGYDGCSD